MEFKIKEKVANKLLNYLISKPFVEVHQLILELQKLEKIEEESKPKE